MPDSDLTLRIEHASGATSELIVPTPEAIDEDAVTLSTIDIEEALDLVSRCEATVFRDSWLDVLDKLDRLNDELYVDTVENPLDPVSPSETIFGGRLDDWQFSGTLVSVQIDSFERDALDCEPPVEIDIEAEPDDVVAAAIIDEMPAPIQAGTIEQTTDSIDYSARHRSPSSMLREFANSTGAEILFHPDGTVDYLESRGTLREETISPTAGSVIEEPRIRQTMREEITHVRAVSEDDDDIYEEATAIETDEGERENWHVDRINSTSNSRLQARATRLANEYASEPEYLEVETTLDPLAMDSDPEVGDQFLLELPAYDVAKDVRVIEADRIIDDGGERYDVLLSNRKLTLSGR